MGDLMKCLYDFVCSRRLGNIYQDPEHEEAARSVELQIKKVRQALAKDQQMELDLLLDSLYAQNSVENEYLFRAALELARELSR